MGIACEIAGTKQHISNQAPLVWRAPEGPEGLAAVPVGGGGAWPGFKPTRRATHQRPGAAGVEGAGGTGGPGCGARGRRRGLAGLRADAPSEARCADGSRAGRRPRAHRAARPHSRARRRPEHQRRHTTARARQRGGYRSTRPLSAHSATASSRLRPNDPQSWRRRRIHRNIPPTTAAPRPTPPIRPSKPVRARRWVRPVLGLVAGTSGAT